MISRYAHRIPLELMESTDVNAIVGALGPGSHEALERSRGWLSRADLGRLDSLHPAPPAGRGGWGAVCNGGAVLGRAHDGDVGLCFLGSFHRPFPSLASSPLDEPDETARALLRRYRASGLSFLDGLCGQFAVAIVHRDDEHVVLARAAKGCHGWFYDASDGFRFATRLLDFQALQGDRFQLDRSYEDFLLGYEFLPAGKTIYRGVSMLGAGQILRWQGGRIERHTIAAPAPYADRFADVDFANEDQVIDALGRVFELAVDDQTPRATQVGVLLGGVDSALIAAQLKKRGKEVHTFSFRYADESFNQTHVEELAELYGIQHHWVPITEDVVRHGLSQYATRFSQAVSQPHYVIATAHVCRAARDAGILHCLTGDGCDGLFLGYPTVHFRAKVIEKLSRVAPLISKPLGLATRSRWLERQLGHPYRVARNVWRILQRPMPARGHIAACTLDPTALEFLRGPSPAQDKDPEEVLGDLAQGLENVGSVRLAYLGKSKVGLNMVKLDGSSSSSGVTLNSPYLHPAMAHVARQIPDELSRPGRDTKSKATGKYAFMQMVERGGLLPEAIVYQRKRSPVTAPVDDWYWASLRSFMLDRLHDLPFDVDQRYAQSLVEPKVSEKLFRENVGIGRYVTPAISMLATYASFTAEQPFRDASNQP